MRTLFREVDLGLDWNPGNRPRSGYEAEFRRLVDGIRELRIHEGSPEKRRFFEISITAFETLNTPRVGHDLLANEWIRREYHKQARQMTLDEWVQRFSGFYVVDLVPPCDGIPRYSNGSPGGYVESFSFRAQFLRDCESILPVRLLDAAYEPKLPEETIAYGYELLAVGKSHAAANNLDPSKCGATDADLSGQTPRYQVDILLSAGRWCVYWGERGHMLDAYW